MFSIGSQRSCRLFSLLFQLVVPLLAELPDEGLPDEIQEEHILCGAPLAPGLALRNFLVPDEVLTEPPDTDREEVAGTLLALSTAPLQIRPLDAAFGYATVKIDEDAFTVVYADRCIVARYALDGALLLNDFSVA